ncbi:hypothetical protein ABIG06_000403 [Bradyrhizobium sp. USDA 326]
MRRPADRLVQLHAVVDALGDDVFELRGIGEERVVKGHLAPDHRRIGVVGQYDTISNAHELQADRRCDLIGAEDNGKGSMVVRLGHLKQRLRNKCSKAQSGLEHGDQEPGHLE